MRIRLYITALVLVSINVAAPSAEATAPHPYCDEYQETLKEAAAKRRQDYPNYAGSLFFLNTSTVRALLVR
ncbi:hypothetical protein [Spiribacter vilamensis]|uniref:Uncharacterized protein n=1 Tax=Spiribacter vilamensis TaxID=531306 RepID=A0A4V2GJ41_9GAMM|nr:hypothetical protein [Spiribacter vilamensis]RZU98775.1 hypothetical protein EV698_1037 [Spiribacter vilamensis]TVO62205.1 hypothetical protein FPL09_09030 [Spiribacter vilamensis]